MDRDLVLANIYLKAVLPLLEDIVEIDEEAKKLTSGWRNSIMFHVGGGPACTLFFRNGKCEAKREKIALPSIAMYFPGAAAANNMFEGGNAMPIIWTGLWHPIVLKNFIALTKRLDYYMKPTDEMIADRGAFPFIVELMLYAALNGACQVAMHDPDMQEIAGHMPDATLQVKVIDGPAAYITKDGDFFSMTKGLVDNPTATMEFCNVDLAYRLFKGEVDAMAALGACEIRICGLVPFVDNFNAFLDRLGTYLPQD